MQVEQEKWYKRPFKVFDREQQRMEVRVIPDVNGQISISICYKSTTLKNTKF